MFIFMYKIIYTQIWAYKTLEILLSCLNCYLLDFAYKKSFISYVFLILVKGTALWSVEDK